ncbi:hypothetical protein BJ878DRAFT_104743 [Calycina marina]|uniref:Uncharacterized protein n=1 Tax=Calycina marina TaxID=1763456 RepID=A0A9P7Z1A6_9HELO|nr:hypothetical protein BJ878DRAFT_104743 [Calycina marina]
MVSFTTFTVAAVAILSMAGDAQAGGLFHALGFKRSINARALDGIWTRDKSLKEQWIGCQKELGTSLRTTTVSNGSFMLAPKTGTFSESCRELATKYIATNQSFGKLKNNNDGTYTIHPKSPEDIAVYVAQVAKSAAEDAEDAKDAKVAGKSDSKPKN